MSDHQKLLSYDPSPLPFSNFRSKDTFQYITPPLDSESATAAVLETNLSNIADTSISPNNLRTSTIDPNFHTILPNEVPLHTFTHALSDPSESLPSSLAKLLRKFHFHARVIETRVMVTTARLLLSREIVTGEWRRRVEHQEYLQNLRRIEIQSENYPRFWISMVEQPLLRIVIGILGVWAPLAWDCIIFALAVIVGLFVDQPSHIGVIVTFCILTFFAFISRIVQIVVVVVSIWRLGHTQKRGDSTATQEIEANVQGATPVESASSPVAQNDSALSQSAQPSLIQTPFLYIFILAVTFLCNLTAFACSFVAFAHSNYGALCVALVVSASIFFSLISVAVMPKFSNRYPAVVKLYFSEIASTDRSLRRDAKLSSSEAYTQELLFYVIVGFLFGWVPGAILAGLLFYVFKTQPRDLGYLQEDNDRVMRFYLSFRDAQNLKTILWRLRSNDVLYYDDPMLR